jgi:hypothetical protein
VEERLKKRILTRRSFPKIALGGGLLLLAAGAAVFIVHWSRPRATWYVEPGLEQVWGALLEKAPAPPPFTRLGVYDPAAGLGKGRYGVIIAKALPEEGAAPASEEGPPIRLYPGLYQNRASFREAIPLALDPWLVLRKTSTPPLTLERVLGGGEGALIVPGAEGEATLAWTAQLLQSSPGVFPTEKQAWEDAEKRLIHGNSRFQQGALTYTWFDGWIRLLQNESAWLYAPLSRTRGLASYDAGRLDASIFPIPADWNTYGLQAEILWAVPRARLKAGDAQDQEALLEEARSWLSAVETQTLIAELLGWIPAQSSGKPYDTLARQAQVAWFSSGFIWQLAGNR